MSQTESLILSLIVQHADQVRVDGMLSWLMGHGLASSWPTTGLKSAQQNLDQTAAVLGITLVKLNAAHTMGMAQMD